MPANRRKLVYWITKEDVQKRAKEKIGRKLTAKELKEITENIDRQLTPELDAIIGEAIERSSVRCEDCKKCGEITCGNDLKNMSCFGRR